MADFKEYEKVRIKENGAIGTIVDTSVSDDGVLFYCVEYDEDFRYLDEDMGITYLTGDKLEKV